MEYKTELPKEFRTWVEFYKQIRDSGLDNGKFDHVIYTNPEIKILKDKSYYPEPERNREYGYKIELVKHNALQELLSERMDKKEFLYWSNGIETILRVDGHKDQSPLILGLRKIKRIVMTLNGRGNEG